ncbi:SET domain-containing protein [Plenodomus tracheiphilus IPT5]|uniref:SET domain-containing protein n=1 Tax=Plenodomus tracheiphilus IPT5 TaxID=1408161 RepID=A0A6A7B2T5_9PLEO|nr:SET domain-containing protein [Plenodomus tracheiphilus IPT5]
MFILSFLFVTLSSSSGVLAHACLTPQLLLRDNVCSGPPEVFTVYSSPGKGLGVFATQDLEIGDIVMRETPAIRIKPPSVSKGSPYPMSTISRLVQEQFQSLPTEAQDEIMSLTFHATTAEKDTHDRLGLIFRTNAYNTGTDIGLFPKIARINHSCRPNTSYYWSEKLNKRIVFASREIKRGEEFSVSYISLLLTREERQMRLNQYGFKCACEVCAQTGNVGKESDARRVKLREAFADLESHLSMTPAQSKKGRKMAQERVEASHELVELVHQEGLADYYAKAYRIAAINHARIEDWQNAAIWSNKGYELRFIEDPKSKSTLEMHHLTSMFLENWQQQLEYQSST